MLRNPKHRLAPLVVAGSLALAACGGEADSADRTPSGEAQQGGALTVATEIAWTTDPNDATTLSSWTASQAIYDRLVYARPDGTVEPGLAESVEMSDDGRRYTVKMRPGTTFHDGTPVDAEAVKVSLDRVRDPKAPSTSAVYFASVDTVEVVDGRTVQINMKRPDVAFLRLGLGGVASGIVSPTALKKYGDKIDQNPVGAGPFKFVRENPGDELQLERFDDYYDPARPYLDKVTLKFIPDAQARYASLTSGAVDVIHNIDPKSIKSAKANNSVVISHPSGFGNSLISLNNTRAPFDDVRAREAVCAATDADAINQAVYLGVYRTDISSPFGPEHPFGPAETPEGHVSYDLDRAKKLVEELGGLDVTLTIASVYKSLGDAIMAQWQAAGIDVTGEAVESTTAIERATSREYEAMPYRYQGDVEPDRNVANFFVEGAFLNTTGYADPEVGRLVAEGRQATDESRRKEIYTQISDKLAEATPMCWLFSNDLPQAWRSYVGGIPDAPDGRTVLRDAYVTQ
ncbi:ABC transporter substrate-binding protein [Streptosporangium sp. NPDC049644]|uniref:ABC transporter substrate-binding protein n=1 Tax=Streptosporangium sp. NPDC049644 TaxID=3155507 RepID=UPI00343F2A71